MAKRKPVSAVFVCRTTEAGLIYRRSSGYGLVTFKGDKEAVEIKLKSSSFGVQIGGSAAWGIGLVMGLKDASHFGGTYSGDEKSATAIDETASGGAVFSNSSYAESKNAHDIFLVITGRGLSAGVTFQYQSHGSFHPSWQWKNYKIKKKSYCFVWSSFVQALPSR